MRPTPTTRVPRVERRRIIELAAGRRFARHGYAATRIDDVAADAGVTKPIIYRHFASKKALYVALLEKHRDDLPRFVEQVELPGAKPSPEDVITAILEIWFDYVSENRHAWVMLFHDFSGDEEIQELRRETSLRAREVMASFMSSLDGSRIPPDQVAPSAELLVSGLAGLVLWWIDNPEVEKETLVEVAARLTLGALGERPGPAAGGR